MRLKGRRRKAEREVSRGRSSSVEADEREERRRRKTLMGKGPNDRESETNVSLRNARRQKSTQVELPLGDRGEAPTDPRSGEASTATNGNERSGNDHLMEKVVERSNMQRALKRVRKNKGSPGIDGMTVDEMPAYLTEHWEHVRATLLDGTYRRSRYASRKYRRAMAESESLGFLPSSIDSSNRRSCRCCNRDSIRPSRSTATDFDLDVAHTTQCARRRNIFRKDADGWWTWIWRNSSTT